MTLCISLGPWCGGGIVRGFAPRLCLGFVSIVLLPFDIDLYITATQRMIHDSRNAAASATSEIIRLQNKGGN